jgi:hypothetical protein
MIQVIRSGKIYSIDANPETVLEARRYDKTERPNREDKTVLMAQ